MSISPFGQALDLLRKNQNILVAAPELISADSLGGALAITQALNKLQKTAALASSASVPAKYRFLTGLDLLQPEFNLKRETIISIATEKNKVRSLRYEKKDGQLFIVLTPEKEPIAKDCVRVNEYRPPEIIVTVRCADWDDLGRLRETNPQFFLDIPVINIDHRPANGNYGTVNLVELTASSSSEIVWRLIKDLLPEPPSRDIATNLLAGIIESTQSFRAATTKPRSLVAASDLMELGADRELIVRSLYKTKPLAALKLLGELLDKMDFYPDQKFLYIDLPQNPSADETEASELIASALEEIKEIFPASDMAFASWPGSGKHYYCFISGREDKFFDLARELNGEISGPSLARGVIENRTNDEIKQMVFKILGVSEKI